MLFNMSIQINTYPRYTLACTNSKVFKEHFNSEKVSSATIAKMKVAVIFFGTLATAIFLAEAIVSDYNLKSLVSSVNAGNIFRPPTSTSIVIVQNVTMMITKEIVDLMDHRYVV